MRQIVIGLLAIILPIAASAQTSAPITATPLPPSGQAPSSPQQPQATQPQPQPSAPQPVQGTWLPQGNVVLQLLDKVNAQNSLVTVKVGQSTQFGSLTIQVQACDVRPPDQPQDSTAFLAITDSRADAPGFRGWMLANNPSLSMLQHPIYDVRVVGCKA